MMKESGINTRCVNGQRQNVLVQMGSILEVRTQRAIGQVVYLGVVCFGSDMGGKVCVFVTRTC